MADDKPLRNRPQTTSEHPEGKTPGAGAQADPEVQKRFDEAAEKGYLGVETDPTENVAYTVAGVTSGQPTPETDEGQRKEVRDYQEDLNKQINGVAER